MRYVDKFSFELGVIDCFNEMVAGGIKNIALSHPLEDNADFSSIVKVTEGICEKYGTKYYVDKEFLVTDLFPSFYTHNSIVILFFKDDNIIEEYLAIKNEKSKLLMTNEYTPKREEIAKRFGVLLGYSEDKINSFISKNESKE